MKLTRLFGFCALVVYSAYLLFLEYTTSQETVDLYFTDIRGPVRFFAINTTLSTFFLWASALIHALNLSLSARFAAPARERAFWLSQVILFAYLGFDDRFSIHEWIGLNLGIDDVFVLITVAALELVVLVGLGRLGERPASVRRYLYAGGALFAFAIMSATRMASVRLWNRIGRPPSRMRKRSSSSPGRRI